MRRRYLITGCFDSANKPQKAVLTIDSKADLVTLRIHRRHDTYETTLTAIAEIAYRRAAEVKAREEKPRRRRILAKRGLLSVK